jgi:Uma2 family endonuclease
MTAILLANQTSCPEIVYPSSDGEPLAESYDHLYVIMTTLAMLLQHLKGQQATVLADQFLYYAPGFPRLRVAPDVMVIFNVAPGGRDNYKTWEEGQVPSVIFEMTSPGTQSKDDVEKKNLYESLGVSEYWQFDPRGEWIPEKLRGYRLQGDLEQIYIPITNNQSTSLQLQLMVEDKIIAFYRLDNGERLLPLAELNIALEEQSAAFEKQSTAFEKQSAAFEKQSAAFEEQSVALDRQKELTTQADQRAELAAEKAREETARAELADAKAREEAVRADQEAQRVKELELQVALYQQRLGELPVD